MKKIQKLCFLALVGLMVGTSCEKTTQAPDPNPQDKCIEGVVIAEYYVSPSNYDPSKLYGCETVVQIKNRNIGVLWRGYSNCVVIKNLDANLQKANQTVYFKTFTEAPQCGPWLAICIPVTSCIIATNLSTKCEVK